MKGRHGPGADLDGFMRSYWDATAQHPIDRRARVWMIGEVPNEHYVATEIRPFDGKIHISSIFSPDREAGHASAVLKQICKLADRHGATLDLEPEPFGDDGGRTRTELEAWYRRHGFESEDEDNDESAMYRLPRRAEEA